MSDSEAIEREGIDTLVQVFGMVDSDARELLRSAGGKVDLAIGAWLEAGQHMVQQSRPGEPIVLPRGKRLGIAQRWARDRR